MSLSLPHPSDRFNMVSLSSLIDSVRSGKSAVELAYSSHERWPLPRSSASDVLRIAILDSSFNPPTLAHLALANAPCPFPSNPDSDVPHHAVDYDAKLLLLSVRNADKTLSPGDATYVQRLEMMILLAKDLVRGENKEHNYGRLQGTSIPHVAHDNVAVGIIDEPTFVGKSRILLQFLRHRLSLPLTVSPSKELPLGNVPLLSNLAQPVAPKVIFLVGMDTLDRLFATRYYPSEQAMYDSLRRFFSSDGDDARVICARRSLSGSLGKETREGHNIPDAAEEFLRADRVTLIDIGEHEKTISSTQIRQLLRMRDNTWRDLVTPIVAGYIDQHRLYHAV